MTGGHTIIDMRTRETTTNDAATVPSTESVDGVAPDGAGDAAFDDFVPEEGVTPPSPWRTIVPVVLAGVAATWVIALLVLARDSLATMTPLALAQFGGALATVPALAGIAWLIGLRTSRAEAQRFAASARDMRAEAEALERTVAALGSALERNRAALREQAGQFSAIGDRATAQLAAIGRGLSEEIDNADVHARALGEAAGHAQHQLAVLLATIPRAQAEAEALTERIDLAALSASEHTAALDAQVAALAERGRDAETVAGGAAQKLAAYMARMEAISETAGARLEGVAAETSAAVDALLGRIADAVDESRRGIAAQGDAMLAMVEANQAALDAAARETADALAERIHIVEIVIDRIAARLDEQRAAGDGLVGGLEGGIARVGGQLEQLHAQGVERSQHLAASISALGGSADAMTQALAAGDAMAGKAIVTTESLLVALDAAAREIDETLPPAMDRLDARVHAAKAVVVAAKPELLALVTAAESTHSAIEAIAQVVADQRRDTDALAGTLLETLATGRAKADALGQMVDEAADRANRFAEEAAPRLLEALLRVRETATQAADHARDVLAHVIPEAAEALEYAGAAALQRAVEGGLEGQIARIATTAETAVDAAGRAAEKLEAQIRAIDAAAAAVDGRLELARSEREAAEQESFARRASLLIEALNSSAIDITRTFAPDVADSAWAAYLKGDRGVFTRRAVRLLDSVEQREIGRLYDDDYAFREQVNRYIHDFESMLRGVLAQHDGSPLGVTLLSSDMGKLYVALAQAIERLR